MKGGHRPNTWIDKGIEKVISKPGVNNMIGSQQGCICRGGGE